MTTQTLDEKLRERARKKLKDRIDATFRALVDALSYDAKYAASGLQNDAGLCMSVEMALWELHATALKAMQPCAEQAEIDAFMTDVANLKSQVDNWPSSVHGSRLAGHSSPCCFAPGKAVARIEREKPMVRVCPTCGLAGLRVWDGEGYEYPGWRFCPRCKEWVNDIAREAFEAERGPVGARP